MAKKKNELDELKKRQSAVLSGNGLSAVKAASAGTADKKAVANSIANEHDAAENVRANQQAVKSQQAKQIAAAHDQQENKPVSGAARRAQQIAAAHDAAENIRARQQRQAVKTAQDIANAHDFRENTRSAGAMSPAAKKAELSLQDIWQRAKAQGDAQKAAEAHKSAEALRALFGFSGGQDGGRVIETARPNLADGEQEQLVNQALRAIALEPGVIDYKSTREPEAPGTKQEQTIVGRILSTFTGGLKGSGAGFINAAGTFAEAQAARGGGVMDEDAALAEQELEGLRANLSDPSLTDEERKWVEQEIAMREQRIQNAELAQRSREGTTRETYALADRVAQSGQEDLARAKEGMGTLGKFLVDVGAAGVQFGADLATGSAGLSMALRSYGGGAQEARQEGASHEQQIVYGAANAALERLTEQISSVGNIKTKAFGAGALDDIGKGVIQAVEELGKTAAGKAVLNRAATAGVNFLSEGLEEAVSEAVTPLLKRAIYSSEPIDLAETAKSAAYSFLVGGALGGVLGGIGGTDTRTEAEPEAVQVPETQTIGRDSDLSTTSIDTNPNTHTPEQLQGIRTYVAAVDRKLKTFFEKYRDDPNAAFSRMTIAPVSERQAADVSNLLGGDFSGYVNAIDRNGVNHILKRHGENGNQDHSMTDLNDAARIGYVLSNYDTVERLTRADGAPESSTGYVGRDNSPSPMIKYGKKINGSYYVVEAVPDSNYKKMWVVSAYIEKNSRNSYASGIDAEAPTETPEAPLPSPVSAENIIAQSGENINRNQGENEAQPQEETKNTANQEMVEKPEAKGGKAGYLYRNIVSGQAEIEKFAGAQKRANRNAVNTEDLAQMSRSVGGTVDAIAGNALVDRKGDKIGKSWKETVGKLSKEESERLNLYRQHLHNIDRMSLQAKAGEKLAEVRQQIAEFKALHTGIDQHTEAELAEFEHNYDLSPAVRESARDYLALLQKEKDLAAVRNKPVLAKNNGKGEMIPYTAEESRAEVKAMLEEHPELAEQAKAAEAFHDQFIREWAIGSGLMSEEQYNAIREKYPHYVQSFRVDHVKTGPDGVTRKGGVNTSNPIRKAVGDITEIVPFEDAEMMQVNSIVRMARRNELFRNIYDFAKANPKDAATYVRVLDAETDAKANVDTDIETVTEAMEQGAMQATGDGYILMAMVDGKPVKMEVNADFYAGLQNLYGQDRGAVNDFLAGTVGKATTAFKQATTGYNVWFPITNFAKDIQTGYINTISDAPTFINYVGEIGGALVDMKRGSDDWKAFRALGGRDSGYYHNEKGFTASDRATRVESVKDVPHAAWEKTKELLSFVGENGEAIMRFAEYKAGVKKYGNTQEGRAKAIQAAADVTVNFSRSAPVAKTFENFVPYLNASIQGLDKMYRQAKEHPVKTTRRNLEMLTVSTLLLWMVNKDDEDYKNLNNRTKDNYFCIPVGRIAEGMGIDDNLRKYGIEVEGKFLKIPKSREWSAVFSALFERYLRTIVKTKDISDDSVKGIISRLIGRDEAESTDKAYRGIGTQLLTNIAPSNPVTDNILKTIFIDLPNNKDFAGRDIVPQRLQGLSPENQYDYTTSDVGKAAAKGWNAGADAVNRVPGLDVPKLAPVQADYLIDSNLGFVGDLLLAAGSDKSALSYFGDTFAQKFTADPKYQNGATDYFYEILDAAETAKNDANLAEGITSRMKTPEEFYYSELNSYKNEISELRKQEREILSGNMSKQEQERRVREIRQKIIEIANEAPGKAQEALEAYKKTYIPEISHLSDEKQEAARKAHDELGLAYNDFARFTDDYAQYVKETMGQEKDTEADVAEMLRGYQSLTDEQRDALYQVYLDNMEKNPFHVSKYEAEMDQTIGLYAEMTEAGRMRIRALLNDYEQDINDGKAEAGKLDGWKAKAYMAEQEAGITPAMYSQYRIALEIANTDGNTNYSQEEAERAVRMLNGLSNEQMAYLFASTNSQWKKNPFGNAKVSKYETGEIEPDEKPGAAEYLVEGSALWDTLTAQASGASTGSSGPKKPEKPKTLDTLDVLKPLKNLF